MTNPKSLETGVVVASSETLLYGVFVKYNSPLSQKRNYFYRAPALTTHFDLKGESTSEAYLKNDINLRIIPALNFGYALNLGKFQLNFEIPIGLNIAITKGTLVNERIGFQQKYSNTDVLL